MIPIRSNLWPSIFPRKVTEERSGSLRLASPPVSAVGWANAAVALSRVRAAAAVKILKQPNALDASVASRMRMWSSGIRARVRIDYVLCPIFRASGTERLWKAPRNALPESEHASTARLEQGAELGRVGCSARG